MFETWGRLVYRRRKLILWLSLAAVLFFGVWGTGVFGALTTSGGFETPNSDSYRAAQLIEDSFGRTEADVIVLYEGRSADDPATRNAVTTALAALPEDKVLSAETFWSTGAAAFVSQDRKATYAVLRLAGDAQERTENYLDIKDQLTKADGLTVSLGGGVVTEDAINSRVGSDIAKADAISIPILLVLLVIIFGGLVAASLPLVIGGIAILGSFTALHALTYVTEVSIFSINITTFMGLGLAIDYGLFMVWRFREEMTRTNGGEAVTTEEAVVRTMATAGRTVVVSGVTVAVSLSGLLLFEQLFLRSMGLGGVATVVVAMLAAIVVLPALLSVLGPRVNARRVRKTGKKREDDRWERLARGVMRRPVVVSVTIVVLLLALGSPFLGVNWGGVDTRVLPEGTETRVVAEKLQEDFPRNVTTPIKVVVQDAPTDAYVAALRQVKGVTGAEVVGTAGNVTEIAVRYAERPTSQEARNIVDRVRDVPAPGETLVGGESATLADQLSSLGKKLPLLGLVVGGAIFVLLFLAFGSLLLPIKAILMNLLSLTAMFGAIVWIFQDGNLAGVLDFTATGDIAPAMPILMLAMMFGISMDYEVFLLSRVREQYDLTGDNTDAVATGLQRTGAIITSAALLFIVVIAAFATSGITFIKLVGVGMVIAIIVDATIVRALLVPATMRLLGDANWWAPGPLKRLYGKYGIKEGDAPAPLEPVVPAKVGQPG